MTKAKKKPAPAIPEMTEAEVTMQIIEASHMLGLVLERQNTGGTHYGDRYVSYGEPGDSDWRATLPGGRRFALEIKRPGKRPTPEQLAKLRELNAQGGVGLWTDDAEKFLRLMPWIMSGKGWAEVDEDGGSYICHNEEDETP